VILTDSFYVEKEFSRNASSYDKYSIIQEKVAEKLLSYIPSGAYSNILDLGAGSGMIYKKLYLIDTIKFDNFFAVDISSKMLSLHPVSQNILKKQIDFKSIDYNFIAKHSIDLVISSSALQWSSNLKSIFQNLSKSKADIAFAIFTSNTFKTIQQIIKKPSPIYSIQEIIEASALYSKNLTIEKKEFKLYFNSKLDMFRYIKKSGVSGGTKLLSYIELKQLIKDYPYNYLEFEVLFISSFCHPH